MARKKLAARDYLPAPDAVPPIGCDEAGCTEAAFAKSSGRNLCLQHFGTGAEARKREHRKPAGQSYRERWYAEHGLPYEPPKLGDFPPFRCVGSMTPATAPTREPGQDDEPVDEVTA